MGIKDDSFVDVSIEEIKNILSTFTNRFEMYIASLMLGSKISFYCDRDNAVPLNTYNIIGALEPEYCFITLRTQIGLRRLMLHRFFDNEIANTALDLIIKLIKRQES